MNEMSGYASVNGLEMYYEIHGAGRPLVLLHGALSATGTSFGKLIPGLGRGRQVIAFEQQAHGRTADIDRPLTLAQMAEDTVAALRRLGIEKADFFGWSMGAGIALQVAIEHPEVVAERFLPLTVNSSREELLAILREHTHAHYSVGEAFVREIAVYARDLKQIEVLRPRTDPLAFAESIHADVFA
jgi:pimeloyl-ACP methyl ester carboxylesterase